MAAATLSLALIGPPTAEAQSQASYPDAVLLVSGFNTHTAFTNPDPACQGQEGPEWNPPTGPAPALRAAGHAVFTAPIHPSGKADLAPCAPGGAPIPPPGDSIDSNGDVDANGAALAGLIAFLRDSYGVQRLQLVAHSDGGLWSRAAITQDTAYSGLAVRSLTTLGTPHTGSFLADLAMAVKDHRCDLTNPIEQDLCKALGDIADLVFIDLGETAVRELSSEFLATWNPNQRIGSCPVTGIAGTYIDLPLIPFDYYNPSDGEVGEASAQARRALDFGLHPIPAPPIPNFREGGTFPVVHSGTLKDINPNNELNTPAVSERVVEIVDSTPAAGELCNVGAGARSSDRGLVSPTRTRMRLPLHIADAPSRRGLLPKAGAEDFVVARRGAKVRCGSGSRIELLPAFGDDRIRLAYPGSCKQRLRTGRRKALLLRSHARNDVLLQVSADSVRVRVRGPKVRALRALVRNSGGGWRKLKLDGRGNADLPAGIGRLDVRVHARTEPGGRVASAQAVLAR